MPNKRVTFWMITWTWKKSEPTVCDENSVTFHFPFKKEKLLLEKWIRFVIDNNRTGLDTSKNQCSAPAVTALKNYWRYHVYNLFRLKNSSNVFVFIIIIIIGCLTGNIIHDQLKLRPYFLPWVSKNRRYRILKGIDRLSDFIFIIEPRSLKFCRRI